MIGTPRTDAVMVDPNRDGNDLPNLARELERELAACRTVLERIDGACGNFSDLLAAQLLAREALKNITP